MRSDAQSIHHDRAQQNSAQRSTTLHNTTNANISRAVNIITIVTIVMITLIAIIIKIIVAILDQVTLPQPILASGRSHATALGLCPRISHGDLSFVARQHAEGYSTAF